MTVLTLKEAAAYLKKHPNTLYKEARAGIIPCRRVGLGQKKPQYRFVKEKLDSLFTEDLPFVDPRRIGQTARKGS